MKPLRQQRRSAIGARLEGVDDLSDGLLELARVAPVLIGSPLGLRRAGSAGAYRAAGKRTGTS